MRLLFAADLFSFTRSGLKKNTIYDSLKNIIIPIRRKPGPVLHKYK
jgi:hypothetical protein